MTVLTKWIFVSVAMHFFCILLLFKSNHLPSPGDSEHEGGPGISIEVIRIGGGQKKPGKTAKQKPGEILASDFHHDQDTVSQPGQAKGQIGRNSVPEFFIQIRNQIESQVEYPSDLQKHRISGEVLLRLTLNPKGDILKSEIARTSGHAQLDELVLEAARKAAPYPERETQENMIIHLPIQFVLPDG